MKLSADTVRILRHLIATIAYRASRSLRDAPADFAEVRLSDTGMTAHQLVQHITNVMAFALATVTGRERIRHDVLDWPEEIDRFYKLLAEVDSELAQGKAITDGMDLRLVQGPLADTLTHIGQLHAMRRKAGVPVAATNYIKADVQIGRTQLKDQAE